MYCRSGESLRLLGSPRLTVTSQRQQSPRLLGKTSRRMRLLAFAISLCLAMLLVWKPHHSTQHYESSSLLRKHDLPLWQKSKSKTLSEIDWPDPIQRCDYVINVMTEYAKGDDIESAFVAQAADANTFYRATARIFWRDFGASSYANQTTHWTESDFESFWIQDMRIRGSNVSLKSLWTWTTGDQHLSNFGAWRNRHGDVVFSVNDFDEGAIYSFEIDVLRLAVSVANHAFTNGFTTKETAKFVERFAKDYVKSVIGYVGNEDAALFEITPKTAKGKLKEFLQDVDQGKSSQKLMEKFTKIQDGRRQFIKGLDIDVPHTETRLAPVSRQVSDAIRNAITPTIYGATRIKLGWNVHDWDPDFFTVLDIAERIGSGIGSYGVDRYYVLLKGTDNLLDEVDGSAVILDVKRQVPGAVHDVLTEEDEAWYAHLFPNDAARVVAAQSRLTSYTDPFLGWFLLPNKDGSESPFSVRQRSPWKDSFNVDKLTKKGDFSEFLSQVALATATAHTRGTVAKPPADFKHVVGSLLGDKAIRKQWTRFLTGLALSYRKQVLMDYACFKEHVTTEFGEGVAQP